MYMVVCFVAKSITRDDIIPHVFLYARSLRVMNSKLTLTDNTSSYHPSLKVGIILTFIREIDTVSIPERRAMSWKYFYALVTLCCTLFAVV